MLGGPRLAHWVKPRNPKRFTVVFLENPDSDPCGRDLNGETFVKNTLF